MIWRCYWSSCPPHFDGQFLLVGHLSVTLQERKKSVTGNTGQSWIQNASICYYVASFPEFQFLIMLCLAEGKGYFNAVVEKKVFSDRKGFHGSVVFYFPVICLEWYWKSLPLTAVCNSLTSGPSVLPTTRWCSAGWSRTLCTASRWSPLCQGLLALLSLPRSSVSVHWKVTLKKKNLSCSEEGHLIKLEGKMTV